MNRSDRIIAVGIKMRRIFGLQSSEPFEKARSLGSSQAGKPGLRLCVGIVSLASAILVFSVPGLVSGQMESEQSSAPVVATPNLTTPTAAPTAAPTLMPSATPTPALTATSTSTPAPVACQGYTLNTKYEATWGRASSGFWHLTDAGSEIRACLGNLQSSLSWAGHSFNGPVDSLINGSDDYADDWAIYTLYGNGIRMDPSYGSCSSALFLTSSIIICLEGQVYFDANCNRIPIASLPATLCDAGYVAWRGSPISLNFAEQNTIAHDMTFTHFPLIPGQNNTWFTWKGSKDHPLVVIDPQHTGSITTPYQLLGNWSFGGYGRDLKTMLTGASMPEATAKPWRHGYEALSTFDQDNDGEIRGNELSPLALWFDENKDGVSDKGEVKSFADAGVTALFYRGSQYDDLLDGYALGVGFERIVGGKTETGSSFDWFSPGDTDKDRLIAFELGRQMRDRSGKRPTAVAGKFLPDAPVYRGSPINGEWEWTSDKEQYPGEPAIGGLLRLLAFNNGELRGLTISESHYMQPYPVNSMINFTAFKGSISKSSTLSFDLTSGPWTLNTSAQVSKDGTSMSGTTTATQNDGKRSFTYTWTAKKRS